MFNNIEFKANQLLDGAGCTDLPVDIHEIARRQGYNVRYYTTCKQLIKSLSLEQLTIEYASVSFSYGDAFYILLSDDLTLDEERKLIAHEIGHLQLHDLNDIGSSGPDEYFTRSDELETDADNFALHLLAPLPLLNARKIKDPSTIRELTGLSISDCRQVFESLREYRDQCCVINSRNRLLERAKRLSGPHFRTAGPFTALLCVVIVLLGSLVYSLNNSAAYISSQRTDAQVSAFTGDSSSAASVAAPTVSNTAGGSTNNSCHPERSEGSSSASLSEISLQTATDTAAESDGFIFPSYISAYYWTESGTVFHLHEDCRSLKNSTEIKSGTLSQAQTEKPRLCKFCEDEID